jgi:hypothetical protein
MGNQEVENKTQWLENYIDFWKLLPNCICHASKWFGLTVLLGLNASEEK